MGLSPTARAAGLAFLTAAVTLFTQVLVHRMVSAKLLNNYAFLVISLTMLGFAFSGVLLTRWLPGFLSRLEESLAVCAALFVLSLLGGASIFYHADIDLAARYRPEFVLSFLRSIPFSLLFAVPFAFCGLILGALLSAPDLPTRRIYFFDLVGSALGAFGVIPAISHLGVETSALAACTAMLVGTLALAWPRRTGPRLLAAAAALAIVVCAAAKGPVFDMSYPAWTTLGWVGRLENPYGIEHIVWDPVARIEVSRIAKAETLNYPCLIGENRAFHERFKRLLTQNNYAFTYAVDYDGTRESLTGIEETIYSAAYHATSVPRPRVAVVGVGGGFDVLNALYFDAARVTGIEINGATVGILTGTYRDYFRKWIEDPRVRLVLAEGRHYLSTTDERFDVLQLSGVDSYSGTAAAAHVFSENYLYTAEAFDLYLSRLTDEGILNMMRLEFSPPREMLRALVTAVGALRRAGVARPAEHILTLTSTEENFTALLVKKTPFTVVELKRVEDWASKSRLFSVSAARGPRPGRDNNYQRFLNLGDPRREAAFVASAPFDISPVDDNRPFFFKYSFWWHIFPSDPVVWASTPAMEYSVILLLAAIGLAALVCIYLPLRYLMGRRVRTPEAWRYGVFFAGTGVGYLAIEIALLQKFGLFLGHPNYALSVVLAALLFASGVGSLFSGAIVKALGQVRFVSYVLAVVVLAEHGLALPRLPGLIGLPFGVRAAIVSALVAPIGVCLGTFVPSALERLKPSAPAYVPWAWGINGIFSVLAPVLSVGFSVTWGINALLLAALPVYLAVGWVFPAEADGSPLSSGEAA